MRLRTIYKACTFLSGEFGLQGPPGDAGESISSSDGWRFKVQMTILENGYSFFSLYFKSFNTL
jgi:hypothetical protein